LATINKIYVLDLKSLKNIATIDTCNNPKGIIAVNGDSKFNVFGYLDKEVGKITITNYDKNTTNFIKAHDSNIGMLAFNSEGSMIATASEKGTVLRVYNCDTCELVKEVRRGKDIAEIYCISFNLNSKLLACSSNHGTIHIFSISNEVKNSTSKFSFASSFVSFLGSEWSFAQFKLSDKKPICNFLENDNLIVLSISGKYYEVSFDKEKGGECKIEANYSIGF